MSSPYTHVETAPTAVVVERNFLRQVFAWMLLALAITTGIAIWFHATTGVVDYFNDHPGIFWVCLIAQLGMVFGLSFGINRISAQAAAILFCLYAALTGLTFSILLEVYTTSSIVGAFAGAAGVFGGMAIYGYTTERDLSGWGAILFGALIGLIVASIAFIFVGGSTFNLILGFAGVIIFAGLTAYDMQKLKEMSGAEGLTEDHEQKLAIFGALALYLDFINIFLSLLRIFGRN
ncbi:MAG TPA: Bax inhibitor-1/YccA family protein [Thermoleophilaceae bacterium]|jgi:FtsH-binding integral membrane protein